MKKGNIFKSIICILLSIIFALSVVSCVETPDKPIVDQKEGINEYTIKDYTGESAEPQNSDDKDNNSPATPVPTAIPGSQLVQDLKAPEHIDDEFEVMVGGKNKYIIKFDADVSMPEGGVFPVYKCEQAEKFDMETFENIAYALFGDNKIHDAGDIWYDMYFLRHKMENLNLDHDGGILETKSVIEKRIELLEWSITEDCPAFQKLVKEYGSAIDELEEYKAKIRDEIEAERYMLEHFAEEECSSPEYVRDSHDDDEARFLTVVADTGGPMLSRLSIHQGDQLRNNDYYITLDEELLYNNGRVRATVETKTNRKEYEYDVLIDYTMGFTDISEEDAKAYADELVERMGLSEKLGYADHGYAGVNSLLVNLYGNYGVHCFIYTPIICGVPMPYIDIDDLVFDSQHSYAGLRRPSALKIYVDEEGVVSFCWDSPIEDVITETLSENAALLKFDEVYEIFKDKIAVQGNFREKVYEESVSVKPISSEVVIDRVELSYYRVRTGGGANSYALIPVWNFMGQVNHQYAMGDTSPWPANKNNIYVEGGTGRSFLMINALDGSIIDPTKGY